MRESSRHMSAVVTDRRLGIPLEVSPQCCIRSVKRQIRVTVALKDAAQLWCPSNWKGLTASESASEEERAGNTAFSHWQELISENTVECYVSVCFCSFVKTRLWHGPMSLDDEQLDVFYQPGQRSKRKTHKKSWFHELRSPLAELYLVSAHNLCLCFVQLRQTLIHKL